MGDENPIRTLGDYSKPSHEGYKNTIELPVGNNMLAIGLNAFQQDPSPHGRILLPDSLLNSFHREGAKLNMDIMIRTIDQTAGGKLRDLNPEESWAILVDLALYDNESWNDPRDFTKSIKAITLPQDVPSTSDRRLIELENQVQRLMEAHLAPTQNHTWRRGNNRRTGSGVLRHFPTRDELTYHRHVHIEKAYIDLNSPLNIMTRMMYNWVMRRKLDPRENANRGISNFTGRIKRMHVFVGNFSYVVDFMIVEDISLIIDPRLSQVVLRKFHWMILGGRFNQLSHVSSPLLSKPGEY
ncbi:hypothetical protein Tco_0317760 [Tanacetum coccineum]